MFFSSLFFLLQMAWISENLSHPSFFLYTQCFFLLLPQQFICIVVCLGEDLWSCPWFLGACLYPTSIGLELKYQSWKERFACPTPLHVLCHWFESQTPYQTHPCVFKCLQCLKIWTLSVCRCASVSFYWKDTFLAMFLYFALDR